MSYLQAYKNFESSDVVSPCKTCKYVGKIKQYLVAVDVYGDCLNKDYLVYGMPEKELFGQVYFHLSGIRAAYHLDSPKTFLKQGFDKTFWFEVHCLLESSGLLIPNELMPRFISVDEYIKKSYGRILK